MSSINNYAHNKPPRQTYKGCQEVAFLGGMAVVVAGSMTAMLLDPAAFPIGLVITIIAVGSIFGHFAIQVEEGNRLGNR